MSSQDEPVGEKFRWPPDSVGELIEYLAPALLAEDACPWWPPDVFAITASVLKRTGAYVRLADLCPRGHSTLLPDGWVEKARSLGEQWRSAINLYLRTQGSPAHLQALGKADRSEWSSEIQSWWDDLRLGAMTPLRGVLGADSYCRVLLKLCLVADEASWGIGLMISEEDEFLKLAELDPLARSGLESLCLDISPVKCRVLPKQHTPQRGATARSLSHNLALCPNSEVRATWASPYALAVSRQLDTMNILLLPWPVEINANSFQPETNLAPTPPDPFRYFSYRAQAGLGSLDSLETKVDRALQQAGRFARKVDAVVFPELALSEAEYRRIERLAVKREVLLVAGVGTDGKGQNDVEASVNHCKIQPAGLTAIGAKASPAILDTLRIEQGKHHRWCLDRNQILQYELGGMIPASKDCWETTALGDRWVHFLTLGSWMTITALICEDLARQDPVTEMLRVVGPNLVIALLMDGPQLRTRWPSRYASVLAEDPGCSVLTLTSLGMSRRSKPRPGEDDRSGIVGLWRDAKYGDQELVLEPEKGHDAAVLSLVAGSLEEFTLDGRGDGGRAHFPVFAGFHPFQVEA